MRWGTSPDVITVMELVCEPSSIKHIFFGGLLYVSDGFRGSQPGESFAIQRLGDHERGAAWHLANILAKWAVAETLGSDSNHFPRPPHGPRGGNANLTKAGTWFEMDFMNADASLATWA